MSYKSPIEVIAEETILRMEDDIVKAVQKCGINVNKTELQKALMYDRRQYTQGFIDGRQVGQEDAVNAFADYQIEWLTAHNDIEFCEEEENLIVRFIKDTAETFIKETHTGGKEMTELKPCPFCGGNAKLVEYWLKGVCNTKHFFVQCKQCGVRKDNHHNGYKARAKAIDDWNKRAKMDEVTE